MVDPPAGCGRPRGLFVSVYGEFRVAAVTRAPRQAVLDSTSGLRAPRRAGPKEPRVARTTRSAKTSPQFTRPEHALEVASSA